MLALYQKPTGIQAVTETVAAAVTNSSYKTSYVS